MNRGIIDHGTGQDWHDNGLPCGVCGIIANGPRQPRRILVVDDDSDCLEEMTEALKRLGHWTRSFASPNDAIEYLGTVTCDILVSDVHMQDMSGPELALWVSANRPGMRIILMSSAAIDDGALREGWKVLPKPAPLSRIHCAIECRSPGAPQSSPAS